MNVVMTADGRLVEVQATAEREPFTRDELDGLLDLAGGGIEEIMVAQDDAVGSRACLISRPAEALLRLLLAAGLGGAIGLEREMRDHEAGFRTHLLVSLGSCAFTLVSAYGWSDWTFSRAQGLVFDPTRIAAQIVTGSASSAPARSSCAGINVRGLTTAATMWVVAAIGMAAGTGYYVVAIGAAVLVLVSLGPLKLVSARFISRVAARGGGARDRARARRRRRRSVLARIEELGGTVNAVEFGDDRTMDVVLRASRRSESGRRRRAAREARGRRARAMAPVRAQLASGNAHKLEELRAALPGWEIELLGAGGFPDEDGETYYENARGKARVRARRWGSRTRGFSARTPGSRRRRSAAGPESSLRGGPRTASRSFSPSWTAPTDRRARYVCELVGAGAGRPRAARNRDPRGDDRERAPRRRGLRLRPDLRAGGRGAHGRRARERLEAHQLPPRPRRSRPPHVRSPRCPDRPRRGLTPDMAVQARPAIGSSSRRASHQLTSAPKMITFAIT